LVFGLRMLEGIERLPFAAATGFEVDELVGPRAPAVCRSGLLEDGGGEFA